ncbi:MAG: hypothetical protein DCF25_00655 [Leptolyngbya foveolarum]|uniref:Uncharacterized protein n=1 Tax=Leptolyngbya foveolarum TaxID=47253 RepID=A0A2W4UR51_9CYAN|nr:MAG: hypothetical protein DCF25_00655 [Leptolyngbya foveolarum]
MKLKAWLDRAMGSSEGNSEGNLEGQSESLRRFLVKAMSGTVGLKILNVGLMYANSLLLVRLAGVGGYGEYSYIIAWVYILLIPAALGLEGVINRELAVYSVRRRWADAKGLLGFSNQVVLLSSVLLAISAVAGCWLLGLAEDSQALLAFAIGIASLPLVALSRLRVGALQAVKSVVASQLPEAIVRPGILFVCSGGLFALQALGLSVGLGWLALGELPVPVVMVIDWVATAIAFYVGSRLLRRKLSPDLHQSRPQYSRGLWLKAAMPMLLIGSMYVINGQTDSVMLGILKDNESVGVYKVANQGAGLISFVQVAFATALGPIFVAVFAAGDIVRLRKIVKQSCRATFALSAVMAVGLVLSSHWFLLMFGPEVLAGRTALFILMGGQLVNAFTGATAQLLIMTGNDRDTALGVSASAVVNVVLNAVLIPPYGINGAAIATAISMVLWNVILVGFTYKHFKVMSTAV